MQAGVLPEDPLVRGSKRREGTSLASSILESVGNLIRIQRQAVFVGILVVVGDGGEIDYHHIFGADVLIRVPDTGWNVHESPPMFGEHYFGDQSKGRRIGTLVVKHNLHFTEQNEVSILMQLVHTPALDPARADRERVGENQGTFVPSPSRVEQLTDRSSRIRMSDGITKGESMG